MRARLPVLLKPLFAAAIVSAPFLPAAAAAQDEPSLVKVVPPEYPRAAERRQIEGRVTVKFSVGADGSVSTAEVVAAEPAGVFDKAATEAVLKWKFESGKPIEGMTKSIDFKLVEG